MEEIVIPIFRSMSNFPSYPKVKVTCTEEEEICGTKAFCAGQYTDNEVETDISDNFHFLMDY